MTSIASNLHDEGSENVKEKHLEQEVLEPAGSYLHLDSVMTEANPNSYLRFYSHVDPEHVARKLTFIEKLHHLFG